MKPTFKLIILISLCIVFAFAQFRSNVPATSIPTNLNGEINSKHDLTIIDFNRFNIQQTFSMAMASNNQHSFSIAGLTNNISYLWNKNLTLDADITLYTSQFPSYNQTNLINEVDLSYNAGITYQPSKNLFLTLRFQKIPYYQKYQTNSPFNMRFIQ